MKKSTACVISKCIDEYFDLTRAFANEFVLSPPWTKKHKKTLINVKLSISTLHL